MKDLDIGVFLAVFQEMLGPLLWLLAGLAVAVVLLFLWRLLRDRGLQPGRLVQAELFGLVGGVLAILVMQGITHSSFADIGGPIDWVLVALIFLAGGLFATMAAYVGLCLMPRRQASPRLHGAG